MRRSLKRIIPFLCDARVNPVLVKGWAVARHYPELGLRLIVTSIFCVAPSEYAAASAALSSSINYERDVDLHLGFGKFFERNVDTIFERSQLVMLGGLEVRVLAAKIICVSFARIYCDTERRRPYLVVRYCSGTGDTNVGLRLGSGLGWRSQTGRLGRLRHRVGSSTIGS
jgi:hypothetical protein